MKIIKDGEVIAELPDKPKDFEGAIKSGVVSIVVGENEVKMSKFDNAHEVLDSLHGAYFANQAEFVLE